MQGAGESDVEFHKLIWEFTGKVLQLALKRAVLPYFAFVVDTDFRRTIDLP
jgi:hypothetical protein